MKKSVRDRMDDFIKSLKIKIKDAKKSGDSAFLEEFGLGAGTENNLRLHRILSGILLVSALVIILTIYFFFYLGSSEDDYILDGNQQILRIVIPHPNSSINVDDYEVVKYKVAVGDNIIGILTSQFNISSGDAYRAFTELRKYYNVKNLKAGDIIIVKYRIAVQENELGEAVEKIILQELRIPLSTEADVVVQQDVADNSFVAREDRLSLTKHYMKYRIDINTSLYVDGIEAGVPANIMMEIIKLYSFDVDFQRDIRRGDRLEILFEEYYNDNGDKVKDGRILYAAMDVNGKKLQMYRFKTNSGQDGYFDENGVSVQKSLLKTPIDGARISSGYGMRTHPVLGYSRAHKGIDFAAPTGTPFYAAGNGTVVEARMGYNGGFGNYIRVRHNNNYDTEYAHCSRFVRGLKPGQKVRQGQVIGYVGATGRVTGPHLHYGIIYNGERINPSRVRSVATVKLMGKELIGFKKDKELIDIYRANTPNQRRRS